MHCATLQRTATCCYTLQQRTNRGMGNQALQPATTHCNTLQHAATYCNTLQHTATAHAPRNESSSAATRYNALQRTATHCNTLQHAATHCNTLQQRTNRGMSNRAGVPGGSHTFHSQSSRGGCCSVLQYVALYFSVLQCCSVAVW